MRQFCDSLDPLCEFTFIEGLSYCPEKPLDFFIYKLGITPPYKRWIRYKWLPYIKLEDGTITRYATKAIVNYEHFEQTFQFLTDFLNQQDQPFDGFLGFSQGVHFL